MATREIKTTIALDGEQSFKNSIKQISKEFRVLDSEMKTISSQYDVTGDKASFLAEKQSLLATKLAGQQNMTSGIRNMLKQMEDAYEDAGRRLDQLRNELTSATEAGNDAEIKRLTEAVKRAETAFEQAASKVQDYQIQLNGSITKENKIQAELNQTQKAIEATDREIEELGRDSIRAGRQLEDGIGEGAENAERSVKELIQTMQEDIGSIRTSSAVSAVTGLWDMATGAYGAVSGFVEGTQEYRRQLSFLKQNAETKGFDFSVIKQQLIEVQGLTGDASSAVEGLSNLLAADVDQRQLEKAVDNLAGAVVTFPETVKFESLADSLQETVATGTATGQFAELLGRLGVDVDEFNEALEESPTAAGDLDIALSYLAAHGMEDAYKQWQKNNGAMSDAMQTQAELEMELAEFGGTLEKYIVTPVKALLVDALEWVNETVKDVEEQGLSAGLTSGMKRLDEAVETPYEQLKREAQEGTAKPNIFSNFTAWWTDVVTGDAFRDLGKNMKEGMTEGLADDLERQIETSTSILAGRVYQTGGEATITGPDGKELVPIGVRDNWEEELAAIVEAAQAAAPAVQTAGETVGDALSTGFEESTEEIESTGEEVGESAGKAFEQGAAGFGEVARMIGVQIGTSFAAGIESQYGRAYAAAGRLGTGANAALRGSAARYSVTAGVQAAAQGNVTAILNLDGRTFARVTAPYMATALAP